MTELLPLHAHQFVLGPVEYKASDDWQSIAIRNGLVLSHCPRLPVALVTDQAGRNWALLGLAAQSDPQRESPAGELATLSTNDVAALHESWTGRWLLIGETELQLDATGLLACFYLEGGPWASSSLALLSQLGGQEEPGSRRYRLVRGDGFNFDPPPRTCYRGIAKLLATQNLDLASGRPLPRETLSPPRDPLPYDEALDRMAACLVTAAQNAARDGWKLKLALSAGYHSRVLLAAAVKAGVAFETYTQSFPLILRADRELPAALAKEVGVRHVVYPPKAELAALREHIDAHCDGLFMGMDRDFYIRQQWAWTKPGDILVRGVGFEVGEYFDWWRLPQEPSLTAVLAAFSAEQAPDYVKQSVANYLAWTARHPLPGVDWRDRWYLDVRLGGLGSGAEHALTLTAGHPFIPASSNRFYRFLLQLPREKRETRQHLIDLIDRLCPALNAFPYNEPDGLLRDSARQLQKLTTVLQERGLRAATYQVARGVGRRLRRLMG